MEEPLEPPTARGLSVTVAVSTGVPWPCSAPLPDPFPVIPLMLSRVPAGTDGKWARRITAGQAGNAVR